jgi:hypothetical protein
VACPHRGRRPQWQQGGAWRGEAVVPPGATPACGTRSGRHQRRGRSLPEPDCPTGTRHHRADGYRDPLPGLRRAPRSPVPRRRRSPVGDYEISMEQARGNSTGTATARCIVSQVVKATPAYVRRRWCRLPRRQKRNRQDTGRRRTVRERPCVSREFRLALVLELAFFLVYVLHLYHSRISHPTLHELDVGVTPGHDTVSSNRWYWHGGPWHGPETIGHIADTAGAIRDCQRSHRGKLDFHATRVTYINLVIEAGASPSTACNCHPDSRGLWTHP